MRHVDAVSSRVVLLLEASSSPSDFQRFSESRSLIRELKFLICSLQRLLNLDLQDFLCNFCLRDSQSLPELQACRPQLLAVIQKLLRFTYLILEIDHLLA